jgi:hypothetical protein
MRAGGIASLLGRSLRSEAVLIQNHNRHPRLCGDDGFAGESVAVWTRLIPTALDLDRSERQILSSSLRAKACPREGGRRSNPPASTGLLRLPGKLPLPGRSRNPRESGDLVLRRVSGDYQIPAFAGISMGRGGYSSVLPERSERRRCECNDESASMAGSITSFHPEAPARRRFETCDDAGGEVIRFGRPLR